jgi:hypothetical protein
LSYKVKRVISERLKIESLLKDLSASIFLNFVITKEFISKTTFLSFHGLTGESRKALDARLRTSGMTYKDVVCADTNDRISKSKSLRISVDFVSKSTGN